MQPTIDIRFKLPNVGPRDLGVDDISLGGDLGGRGSGKSNISVNRWLVNYLKTYTLAPLHHSYDSRHTVVEEHLTEFLGLLICRSLGSIDIIDMVFHVPAISSTPSSTTFRTNILN